jgi:hypothetical protein
MVSLSNHSGKKEYGYLSLLAQPRSSKRDSTEMLTIGRRIVYSSSIKALD